MLTIIAVGCVWGARAQATWMGDNAALLGKKQLNELVIPGTHDTGTFGIIATKSKGIGLGDSDGLSSPDNKKVKRFLSFGSVFTDWAKTQEKTSLEMLDDGVRYFDLRVCVDNKGVFMTCHGLYGAPLETILDDVKKFTDAHPREVVLLGFNHFWDRQYQTEMGKKQGELEGLTKANWTALVALVKTKLGDKLVSGKTFGPASRLGELWQLKQNNQVIALFDTDDAPDDEFLWKRREENTWVGGWDPDVFKSGTLKVLENAKSGRYAGKFFAVRSSVTPDDNGQLIGMGFLSKVYPKSNSELADQTNPVALGWIRNEWAGKYPLNLIWCDFYNRADLVKLAKSLNGIKVDFTGTKIGTDTNWTKWKTSKDAKK
ncbi:MAG: hypothetical protein JSS81_27890 [Acidobacteria bacterium]|nr:hypothetical protein [Acidobacteriota bacterium]